MLIVDLDKIKRLIKAAEKQIGSESDAEQIDSLKKAVEIVEYVNNNCNEPKQGCITEGMICVSSKDEYFSFSSN
jgi:hypothetical protein